jgi:hypothetical protein
MKTRGSLPSFTLWVSADRSRHFLVAEGHLFPDGSLEIGDLAGRRAHVSPAALAPYEITEEQARRWAKDQLGQTLDELKDGLDERLAQLRQQLDDFNRTPVTPGTTITPDAATAMLGLLKALPGVVARSLSADPARVDAARTTMTALQERLRAAGIAVDDRVGAFPERLAGLRRSARKDDDPR